MCEIFIIKNVSILHYSKVCFAKILQRYYYFLRMKNYDGRIKNVLEFHAQLGVQKASGEVVGHCILLVADIGYPVVGVHVVDAE